MILQTGKERRIGDFCVYKDSEEHAEIFPASPEVLRDPSFSEIQVFADITFSEEVATALILTHSNPKQYHLWKMNDRGIMTKKAESIDGEYSLAPELMYRQEGYDCAAHSIFASAACHHARYRNEKTLNKIKNRMSTYTETEGVSPFVITSILGEYGMKGSFKMKLLSTNEGRITFLKEHLKNGPVILLVKTKDTAKLLHYITVIRHEDDKFFIYDSYEPGSKAPLVTDHNGDETGNLTLSSANLLDWWKTGNILFLSYMAITTEKSGE